MEEALALAAEILNETRFDDSENAVLDILKQTKTQLFQQIIMNGSMAAIGRIAAQISVAGVVEESIGGVNYYQWLKKQESEWYLLLPEKGVAAHTDVVLLPYGIRKEGIVIPADISFAAMEGNLSCSYTGELQLASRIISLGYLWNVIRVQGGAYGTGMLVRESGLAACYSYRDPNAAQSLDSYRNAATFLRDFCKEVSDLTGFIIGAVSDASPLLTPRMKAFVADSFYWRKISWERRTELRRNLLSATTEKLTALADQLEQAIAGGICVVGSREQIELCKELNEIFALWEEKKWKRGFIRNTSIFSGKSCSDTV